MKHATLWDIVSYPNDPADDRIQGDEWNESHSLEADENFVTNSEKTQIANLGNFLYLTPQSSDPVLTVDSTAIWMSDGTESGDNGDVLVKMRVGAVEKIFTLGDFSVIP